MFLAHWGGARVEPPQFDGTRGNDASLKIRDSDNQEPELGPCGVRIVLLQEFRNSYSGTQTPAWSPQRVVHHRNQQIMGLQQFRVGPVWTSEIQSCVFVEYLDV